jgi:hypothetical protein
LSDLLLLLGGRIQHWRTSSAASSRGICGGEQRCWIDAINVRRGRETLEHLEVKMCSYRVSGVSPTRARITHTADDLTGLDPLALAHLELTHVRV